MTASLSFTYRGNDIPVNHDTSVPKIHAEMALTSDPFQTWISNLSANQDPYIKVKSVEIQGVDLFGSKRVGFIKMKVNCSLSSDKNETPLPGICFLRGPGVGMLVILHLKEQDESYCLLLRQPRIPIGESQMLELPAGMLDSKSHTFSGTAARELEEECGIIVSECDLIELTPSNLYPKGISPSPGGCDEYLKLFCYEQSVTQEELDELQGKLTGERDHGELITLRIIKLDHVWKQCCDAKLLSALFLYDKMKSQKEATQSNH